MGLRTGVFEGFPVHPLDVRRLLLLLALAGTAEARVIEVQLPAAPVSPVASAVPAAAPSAVLAASPSLALPAPVVVAPAPQPQGLWAQARGLAREVQDELAQAFSRRRELPRIGQADGRDLSAELGLLFDGSVRELPGAWEPEAGELAQARVERHEAALSPALAESLSQVSRLPAARRERVLAELMRAPVRVRGPPAFSEDHTFSLELEFLVNRQLDDSILEGLFSSDPMTRSEMDRWRKTRELSPARWEAARAWVARRALAAAPAGWRLKGDPGGSHNTLEFNTGGANREFHVNSPGEWDGLLAGLARVQEALPGGLYGVHVHNGLASRASSAGLRVDGDRFARLMKVHEAMWRALAGLGYRPRKQPAVGQRNQILYLPWDALRPGWGDELVRDHGIAINLHPELPTVENRLLSGLLRKDALGRDRLDGESLAGELWFAFALQEAAAGTDDFELATLGVPVTSGMRPSLKQILHFADRVFKGDVVGKALAIRKLLERYDDEEGLDDAQLARAEAQAAAAYRDLGLGVVYDLHAEHDGLDESLLTRLRSPGRLSALARDLSLAHADPKDALALFPASFRPTLGAAIAANRPSWWRRAFAAARRHS